MHRLSAALAVLTLSTPVALLADVAPGAELWIDGPTPVTNDPIYADVAVDDGGRRVYVWEGFLGAERDDIYRRQFDAAGTPLEDPVLVNTLRTGDQQRPRLAIAGDGSFLVIWQSAELDSEVNANRYWVRGQAFAADGSPVGPEQLLSSLSSGSATEIHADVAALRSSDGSAAGYVVVWESNNTIGSDTNKNVQARLASAAGVPLGDQFQVNSTIAEAQTAPAVTELADGGFLVVWDGPELMGRRFSAAGAAPAPDFQISTAFSGQKLDPDAAIGWNGTVAVAWMDAEGAGDGREIRARLFDAGLTALGDDFRVNTLATLEQSQPRLADLGPAGFVVAWESQTSVGADDGDSIQWRVVKGAGGPVGGQLQLNEYESLAQQFPGAHGWYGRAAVAWRSSGNATVPITPNVTARHFEGCLFCDDLDWGSAWRWSETVP